MPSIRLSEIEEMTLLEIDRRLEFIIGAKIERQRFFLKDLSSLIFYGVSHGYAATQSKKNNYESRFHALITKLLQIENKEKTDQDNVESELGDLFR